MLCCSMPCIFVGEAIILTPDDATTYMYSTEYSLLNALLLPPLLLLSVVLLPFLLLLVLASEPSPTPGLGRVSCGVCRVCKGTGH